MIRSAWLREEVAARLISASCLATARNRLLIRAPMITHQAQGPESDRKGIVQPEPAFCQHAAGERSVQATGISRRSQRQEEGAGKQV
ncbi:hypothetical protein [Thermogemmatispora tikiterensis]|uniref:hypothetical protein n=1 Tax=Thermogemmatispora tikiterensis TaxID=1825093 RepID=UPI0011BF57BB|nr:hypothetical protein [Thermogemmatispora tikiterensis]